MKNQPTVDQIIEAWGRESSGIAGGLPGLIDRYKRGHVGGPGHWPRFEFRGDRWMHTGCSCGERCQLQYVMVELTRLQLIANAVREWRCIDCHLSIKCENELPPMSVEHGCVSCGGKVYPSTLAELMWAEDREKVLKKRVEELTEALQDCTSVTGLLTNIDPPVTVTVRKNGDVEVRRG